MFNFKNINWKEQWVQASALFFLFVGFVISVILTNPAFVYISVFLAGFLAARVYYTKYLKEPILPFVLMILGFFLGYFVGAFWASRLISLFFFTFGFALSYYLHVKKIIGIFKSESFLK